MIGVFLGDVRVGSILKFPHQAKPWVAYSYNETRDAFKTKKAAKDWLVTRHNEQLNGKAMEKIPQDKDTVAQAAQIIVSRLIDEKRELLAALKQAVNALQMVAGEAQPAAVRRGMVAIAAAEGGEAAPAAIAGPIRIDPEVLRRDALIDGGTPVASAGALRDALEPLYEKLASSPLGMSEPWSVKPSNGKPLLYGGKRGLLAYGTIATWDEFALIAAVVNVLPTILAAIAKAERGEAIPFDPPSPPHPDVVGLRADGRKEPEKFSGDAVAAYADVVRQGDAIYRQEQNDIQDRRAIRTFVDRFRPLAALSS